jgi:hypothetical protein
MALVIVHPDYSSQGASKQIYELFLRKVKERGGYWHALPGEVASWWNNRANQNNDNLGYDQKFGIAKITLNSDDVEITICREPAEPVKNFTK